MRFPLPAFVQRLFQRRPAGVSEGKPAERSEESGQTHFLLGAKPRNAVLLEEKWLRAAGEIHGEINRCAMDEPDPLLRGTGPWVSMNLNCPNCLGASIVAAGKRKCIRPSCGIVFTISS